MDYASLSPAIREHDKSLDPVYVLAPHKQQINGCGGKGPTFTSSQGDHVRIHPQCREMRELDEDYGVCRNNSGHRTQPNHIEVCAGVARTLASHRHLEGILEPLECVVSQYQAPLKLNTRAHKITFLYGSELKCRASRQIFMFWLTATGFLQEFGCLGRDRSAVPTLGSPQLTVALSTVLAPMLVGTLYRPHPFSSSSHSERNGRLSSTAS